MNICIFPGTFNPIHEGHIKMAEFVLKNFNFDKIVFIPSYLPPHKKVEDNLALHRMNMVKIAVQKNRHFEVSDIEYQNNSTSYSLITVQKIKELYNIKDKVNFIIGTDAFTKIETWYKAEELRNLVHFIVFPRIGEDYNDTINKLKISGWDFELVKSDFFNISSTQVRNFKSGYNDNKEIEEYIKQNELYRY